MSSSKFRGSYIGYSWSSIHNYFLASVYPLLKHCGALYDVGVNPKRLIMLITFISLLRFYLSCYTLVFEFHNGTEVKDIIFTRTISTYWNWISFQSIHKFKMTSQNNCEQEKNDSVPIITDAQFEDKFHLRQVKNWNPLKSIHFFIKKSSFELATIMYV